MNLSNLKDYQFVLLIITTVLLILVFFYILFYSVKRKYDSIDKHISDKRKETYKECMDEYDKITDELGIEHEHVVKRKIINFIKKIIIKK